MNRKSMKLIIPIALTGLLAGCLGDSDDGSTTPPPVTELTTDQKISALIKTNELKGDAIESLGGVLGAPKIPAIVGETDPTLSARVELGKLLFFSKDMSFNKDVACVTCHHPVLGGGDNVALPIGVNPNDPDLFGPGRLRVQAGTGAAPDQIPPFTSNGIAGNPAMPRNSPTVFGLGFWDKSITWDGTVVSEKGTKGLAGIDSRIVAPIDLPPVSYVPALALSDMVGVRADLVANFTIDYSAKFDSGMLLSAGHGMFPGSVAPAMRSNGFRAGTCGNDPTDNPAPKCTNGVGGPNGNYTDLDIRKIMANRFATAAWSPYFTAAFGSATPTANNISTAVATYERTQTFTQTPWRSYVKGDLAALSDSQKRGALVFFQKTADGGADCASCHKGDFFTDEENYVLAIPQIGRGKADKNSDTDNNDDWGRGHVTGLEADKYAYRVPTLLNIEMTGPYGHDGVYDSLEDITRHHLNVEQYVNAFNAAVDNGSLASKLQAAYGSPIDFTRAKEHTALALSKLKSQRAANQEAIKDINLTDTQVKDLVEFMKALTDPCTKDKTCLAKWVPLTSDTLKAPATAASLNLICPKDKTGAKLIPNQLCQ
ncbi:MAG: cytochrome c peroxidase [Rhodocyclaceae bacterium]|nr:cytochrome c peroxidase [Rhodocyclaceae bacterium]